MGALRASGAIIARPAALRPALVIPAVFVVENVLGGPFGSYAGIPVRYALFGASLTVLALLALSRGTVRTTDAPAVALVLGLLGWQAIWATLVPAAHATDVTLAWTEFRPLLVLLLPPLATVACATSHAVARLVAAMRGVVVRSAAVLAVLQIGIWVAGTLLQQYQAATALFLARAFPGTEAFLYVGPMPDGFFRVFWVNSVRFTDAFFWVPLTVRRAQVAAVLRAVLLGGLFVTYSRGIWLGVLVGSVVAFAAALRPNRAARQLGRVAIGVLLVGGAATAVLTATGQIERAVERVASTAPQSGAAEPDERLLQVAPLLRVWEGAPLFGVGYGGYAHDYVRSETAPFSYENTPYAMLAKLGLVGLLGTLGALAYCAATAWRARHAAPEAAPRFLGAYVSFLLATMTNPMLLNFVGVTVLSCLLLQWAELRAATRPFGAATSHPAEAVAL